MINFLISALALAGAVSASPFPQNFCPAGCDVIVTEHPNPDPHQVYFFQQMTRQNGGVTVSGGPQSWPFGNQYLGIVPDMDEIPPRTAGKV
ncbi:40S ribosomal protein S14 [Verticillium dahliae VDG1]|nr:40S ribosomal protein S14 [Verticillium dahliae VDG1]